jgi:hypothetical protein
MAPDIDKLILDFSRRHNLAVEELTERQLAAAFRAIIQSGDLVRYVSVGPDQQTVVYLPGRREEELKTRIRMLEDFLRTHNIPIPPC